jgi:hypothetical protein
MPTTYWTTDCWYWGHCWIGYCWLAYICCCATIGWYWTTVGLLWAGIGTQVDYYWQVLDCLWCARNLPIKGKLHMNTERSISHPKCYTSLILSLLMK